MKSNTVADMGQEKVISKEDLCKWIHDLNGYASIIIMSIDQIGRTKDAARLAKIPDTLKTQAERIIALNKEMVSLIIDK